MDDSTYAASSGSSSSSSFFDGDDLSGSLASVAGICGFDSCFDSTGVGFPLTLHGGLGDSAVDNGTVSGSELISTIFAAGGTAYSVKEKEITSRCIT